MRINRVTYLLLLLLLLPACAPVNETSGLDTRSNEVAEANLNVGIAYLKRGEYNKALDKLNKAYEADPRYTPTLNALGLLYQKLGNNEKAEQYFKQSLGIRSDDAYTLNNYGQFLCINDRYTEAEDAFKKAAANPLYETPEISLANIGTCALRNGDKEKAEKYFRLALEKNARVAPALIQMGQISYDQGNYLSARGYLQRYLEVARHTPASLWLGIRVEKELGDKDTLSSYALLLRNNFPDSDEAALLRQSGLR
ncbi:MAG TPA: type IV pilus biogenesis/stability protein PilW [Gammaproteobacteria bacterium]|nr:type IV pilus biogenesis/stability protein PilW [Gammaproteobacteria bacterium]